jgi:hypothetical protein
MIFFFNKSTRNTFSDPHSLYPDTDLLCEVNADPVPALKMNADLDTI